MAIDAELIRVQAERHVTNERLLSIGGAAMWGAALDMRPDLYQPAADTIGRAVKNGIGADPHSYFTARIYDEMSGLYGTWADGGVTTDDALNEASIGLSGILKELKMKDMDSQVVGREIIAGLTIQMLLHRMDDPFYVALPAPPLAQRGGWRDIDNQPYPRSNLIFTTSQNELIPGFVRATDAFRRPNEATGFLRLGVGRYLVGHGQHVPLVTAAARNASSATARSPYRSRRKGHVHTATFVSDSHVEQVNSSVIGAVAQKLILEAHDGDLDPTLMTYLDRLGHGIIGIIESIPRRNVPLRGFAESK